jgi:hypothetical protein
LFKDPPSWKGETLQCHMYPQWYTRVHFYFQYCIKIDSKLDVRPSNLQLIPWNFQIQYSYFLNRSSSISLSEISGSATLFTNKCIRRRNIAFLQACHLQIWQLSIANEDTCYIIIALEYVIKFVGDFLQVGGLLRLLRFSPPAKLTSTIYLKYLLKVA